MDIALDKVCDFIVRAKAIDVKEGMTDPASGSNPRNGPRSAYRTASSIAAADSTRPS